MTGGLAQRSQMRLPHATRTWSPYGRTDGLTEKELQLRGDLSVRTAHTNWTAVHALLIVGLVVHRATNRRPVYVGRHREQTPTRGGHGITWWIYAAIATGYAWLTWRMAVIELPFMVAAGVVMTLALAYTAGRNHP